MALISLLITYGINIVINYRATYEWSYELALTGMCFNPIVAIGTLGTLRDKESRELLKNSIDLLVEYVRPRCIIVYGFAPKDIFTAAIDSEIEIWQYDSEISKAFGGND